MKRLKVPFPLAISYKANKTHKIKYKTQTEKYKNNLLNICICIIIIVISNKLVCAQNTNNYYFITNLYYTTINRSIRPSS